jgi:hypothetical protein
MVKNNIMSSFLFVTKKKRSKEKVFSRANAFRLLPFDKLRDQSASFGRRPADMVF